jgi:hypothetical protein
MLTISRLGAGGGVLALIAAASCGFDRADRWEARPDHTPAPLCELGQMRCTSAIERCSAGPAGPSWSVVEDCAARGLVCAPTLFECKTCVPDKRRCDGQKVWVCDAQGNAETLIETCDPGQGVACRQGGCTNLCQAAKSSRSNVGCEYWPVDLDNANVGVGLNAASQQFAVVISNPQPDVSAKVVIEQDDSAPGEPNQPYSIASAIVPPLSLRVFKLGPREVDGSPPGEFDTGSHTALTRAAFRVTASFPVVAYQFNPLENVNVFSNDASLLKPVEALDPDSDSLAPAYTVLGWPQTIASTEDPSTNFSSNNPVDLRAFLTIVGTRPNTRVKIETRALVIGGGPVPTLPIGGVYETVLGPFDVLNLESDDFNGDFTGSIVHADGPVVVFSGGEASDAPFFSRLSERHCCADHLEEQLDPIRTAGKTFVATVSANRSRAVVAAGATIGVVEQPEYFRVVAATEAGARIRTSLAAYPEIVLPERGSHADLTSAIDFVLDSDAPIMLGNVSASQDAAGVPRGLPGGDPSFVVVPPYEQFRSSYVFLTPDKYSFDFIRVIAPKHAAVVLDGQPIGDVLGCEVSPIPEAPTFPDKMPLPELVVWRCQLSFPVIDPTKEIDKLSPGLQNDGVHRIDSNQKVGVLVDGFDAYVSYGYAAGTELMQIVPR